jgi:hypothetical protein
MRLSIPGIRGHRALALWIAVAFVAAVALSPWAGHAGAAQARTAIIIVPTKLIPTPPMALPVLRLKTIPPPTSFVNSVLPNVGASQTKLVPLNQIPFYDQHGFVPPKNLIGAFHGSQHLSAFEDLKTGEAAVYPDIGSQKPVAASGVPAFLKRASGLARNAFTGNRLIPKDSTHYVLNAALPLDGQNASPQAGPSPTTAGLAYVPVARMVGRYLVDGPGSTSFMAFDAQGKVEGFMRNWKSASKFTSVHETRSKSQIARLIGSQLAALKPVNAQVLGVSIAYYDGNRGFMQPVYRFTAKVDFSKAGGPVASDFELGYVGIGKRYESIPVLGARSGAPPTNDPVAGAPRSLPRAATGASDPCVGRYVVQNDSQSWVDSANGFYAGISSYGGGSFFSNCQYYWAIQPQYDPASARVNSMNITDSEGHGDWWVFSTVSNCCNVININPANVYGGQYQIPYPGYGAAAGGNLDYWIIHSCEVVPSPSDTADWYSMWWNIFGGLHSVMGYRTIMYIADGAMAPYGLQLRLGAPVVAAWLGTVMSLGAYSGGPTGTMHGVVKHLGRPSAISMSNQVNDSAYDTSAQPRAGSLSIFWYPG